MVNVIIPVYNSNKVLEDALRSLENQTKKMFFVTVVDDCSEEDINAVCEKFSHSLHIACIKTPVNGGPGAARQLGIDKAIQRGFEYIMFLDADDILYPRAVEILSREISRNMADIVVSPIQVEKKNDPGFIIEAYQSTTWLHGKIYRTAYLKENNIRFTTLSRYNEDGPFNTLAYNLTDKKFFIEEPLYLWRDYNNSITRSNDGDFWNTCYPDFILNMCESLQILIDKNSLKSPVENLCNLYNAYQSLEQSQISESISLNLFELLSQPIFNEEIKTKKGKMIVLKNIKCGNFIGKKFKWFTQTFYDWYNNHSLHLNLDIEE